MSLTVNDYPIMANFDKKDINKYKIGDIFNI